MKKLLSLLGSISILGSSLTVVGFSYANLVKSSIEAKIKNYVNISSLLARGTILSQKSSFTNGDNPPETTDGQDFSLRYASQYLYGQKMSTFFNHTQFPNGNVNVLTYFGSMFNLPTTSGYVYTARENPDFELNSHTLHLQADDTTGKSGSDDTIGTLATISAGAVALLEKGFNPKTTGPLIENLAAAGEGPILQMMENGTFQTIHDILSDSLFEKLSASLNETDLETKFGDLSKVTYADAFDFRQIRFWQGLAEILFSGTYADNPDKITEIMNNVEKATTSKKMAEAAIPSDSDIGVEANKFLIDGIVRILPYLRTLFNYMQSFSEINLPINQITGYNYLFDSEKTNGVFMTEHLNTNYLNLNNVIEDAEPNSGIVQWVKNNNSYHQVLNLQDLIHFFQELFNVDLINDPNGYHNIRVLSILLELPLKDNGNDKADVGNPVFDNILEPLLVQLLPKLVPSLPGIVASLIPQFLPPIRAVLTHNHNFWDPVPGAAIFKSVIDILNTLAPLGNSFVPGLGTALGQIRDDAVEEQKAPKEKQTVYGQPYKSLFSGDLLPRVLKILIKNEVARDVLEPLLGIFKNLATIFTADLAKVLAAFGLDITTLPIFLYGIKGQSLTDIMDTFADKFNVKINNSLKNNQEFLFNLGAIERIISSLEQTADLQFKDGVEIPEPVKEVLKDFPIEDNTLKGVNLIDGVLVTFAYSDLLEDVNLTNGDRWKNYNDRIKKYTFLLGTRVEKGLSEFKFADKSLFAGLAQIYNYDSETAEEPEIIQTKNATTINTLISGLAELVNWFTTTSIPNYIADIFDPYFDSKNWRTSLIKARYLDDLYQTATINYHLYYKVPGTKETHRYEVTISRDPVTGNDEEWAEMGTWKIDSINLKP